MIHTIAAKNGTVRISKTPKVIYIAFEKDMANIDGYTVGSVIRLTDDQADALARSIQLARGEE
jgi:hypothetical protein